MEKVQMKSLEVLYESEYDILSVAVKGSKSAHTLEINDNAIDFDSSGKVIGVEINDASKSLSLPRNFMGSLKDAFLKVKQYHDGFTVMLGFKVNETPIVIQIPISAQAISGE